MPVSEPASVSLELDPLPKMDRLRKMLNRKPAYQRLGDGDLRHSDDGFSESGSDHGLSIEENEFSWLEYSIFLLLGMAMLWAW